MKSEISDQIIEETNEDKLAYPESIQKIEISENNWVYFIYIIYIFIKMNMKTYF